MASDTTNRGAQSEASGNGRQAGIVGVEKDSAMTPSAPASETTAPSGAAGTLQSTTTVRQVDLVLGQIVSVLMRSPQMLDIVRRVDCID